MKIKELVEDVFDASDVFTQKRHAHNQAKKHHHNQNELAKTYKEKSYPLQTAKEAEAYVKERITKIQDERDRAMLKFRLQLAPIFKSYAKGVNFFEVLSDALFKFPQDMERQMAAKFMEEHYRDVLAPIKDSLVKFDSLKKELSTKMDPQYVQAIDARSGLEFAVKNTNYLLRFFKNYMENLKIGEDF